jgi:hypothetical protein
LKERSVNSVVFPLPLHLFQSQRDREAALSYLGGIQAATWMMEFIKGMPDGMPEMIETPITKAERSVGIVTESLEIEHCTKGVKLRTIFRPVRLVRNSINVLCLQKAVTPFDGSKHRHSVLKVTLRSGEKYAVDLAGTQDGHFDPVTPWKEFEEKRILNVVSVKVIFLSLHRELKSH